MSIDLFIPLRTGTGLNERMHWAQRAKKVKHERHTTAWAIKGAKLQRPELPVVVTITRGTTSHIPADDDNCAGGLKAVRDELASWLGVDDGDKRVTWKYAQATGLKKWGVTVRIDAAPGPCQTAPNNERGASSV